MVAALVWRLAQAGPRFSALRGLGMAGSVAATGLLVVWMAAGPLQHGWAKAAGTPADLLAGVGGRPHGTPAPATLLASGLNDPLIGRLVRSATNVIATLTDTRDTALQLVVTANADGTGTLTVTRSGAACLPGRGDDREHRCDRPVRRGARHHPGRRPGQRLGRRNAHDPKVTA